MGGGFLSRFEMAGARRDPWTESSISPSVGGMDGGDCSGVWTTCMRFGDLEFLTVGCFALLSRLRSENSASRCSLLLLLIYFFGIWTVKIAPKIGT